jgi:GWxTD domain-containing protein
VAALVVWTWGCTSLREAPPSVRNFLEGPERWLLVGEERREVASLGSRFEMNQWVEGFWLRRDGDLTDSLNPTRELFERRVRDADRLYGEGGVRGSLTVRGRALILLGPPSVLRRGHRPSPRWRRGEPIGAVRDVVSEEWLYPPQRLPTLVATALAQRGDTELSLRFVEEAGRWSLVGSDEDLRRAAESWVAVDPITDPRGPGVRGPGAALRRGPTPAP